MPAANPVAAQVRESCLAHLVDLLVADGEVKGVAHAHGSLNRCVDALQFERNSSRQ
jgi:hypothetical protein